MLLSHVSFPNLLQKLLLHESRVVRGVAAGFCTSLSVLVDGGVPAGYNAYNVPLVAPALPTGSCIPQCTRLRMHVRRRCCRVYGAARLPCLSLCVGIKFLADVSNLDFGMDLFP